jgi:membrane protein DedA with SNARE-associated domain
MGIIGDLLSAMATLAVDVLSATGYPGLLLLMAGESMVLPIPSEAVMPFAGFLVAQGGGNWLGVGGMTWAGAIVASSLGSLVGSYASYLMGKHGLLPLVIRYGKYVFVQEHHLHKAHLFFSTRGTVAVFLCRFIPGVRHVSSIPAGSARMPLLPFLAASVLGATIWNVILLYIGFKVGQNAEAISEYKHLLDLAGIALVVLLVAYVWYEVRKARQSKAKAKEEAAKEEAAPLP